MKTPKQNTRSAGAPPRAGGFLKRFQHSLSAQVMVLLLAAGFLTLGITRGEVLEVFKKAVKICLECIGLG